MKYTREYLETLSQADLIRAHLDLKVAHDKLFDRESALLSELARLRRFLKGREKN